MTTAKGVDSPTLAQNLLRVTRKLVIQCSMPGRGSNGIKFAKFDWSDRKVFCGREGMSYFGAQC